MKHQQELAEQRRKEQVAQRTGEQDVPEGEDAVEEATQEEEENIASTRGQESDDAQQTSQMEDPSLPEPDEQEEAEGPVS